jgi:hypothetical protein
LRTHALQHERKKKGRLNGGPSEIQLGVLIRPQVREGSGWRERNERLIKKLELDNDILADQENDKAAN